jgi:hypothetical protein
MDTTGLVPALLQHNNGSLQATLQSLSRMYNLHVHDIDLKTLDELFEEAVVLVTGNPSVTLTAPDLPLSSSFIRLKYSYATAILSSNPFWQTCPIGAKVVISAKDDPSQNYTARVINIQHDTSGATPLINEESVTDPNDLKWNNVFQVTLQTVFD